MDADEAFLIYSKEVLLINLCLDLAKMVDTATYIALKDTMAEERTNKRRKKNLCEFCLESRSVLSYSLLLGLVDGSAWKFTARSEGFEIYNKRGSNTLFIVLYNALFALQGF
jgi:hypothetical protein